MVELTSIVVPDSSSIRISNIEISKVPPPKSYTATFSSFFLFLSKPYARAAAVGSFIILFTSNPAIFPASFVAFLCESLKYEGTVTIATDEDRLKRWILEKFQKHKNFEWEAKCSKDWQLRPIDCYETKYEFKSIIQKRNPSWFVFKKK